MTCGVYAITAPSGRQYIGSAINIARRWSVHRCDLRRGRHPCVPLQRAFAKYGESALRWEIIEETAPDRRLAREQLHMDARGFTNIYNILPEAGGMTGRTITPAMRRKLSESLKGRKFAPETIERMRRARMGASDPQSVKDKRAAALRGRVCSEATRAKIRAAQIGKRRPAKTNASGFVNVQQYQGKWRAQYGRNYLGYHATAALAAAAVEAFKATGVAKPLRTNNTSGVRGVVAKGSRWQASARTAGKRHHLGTFATIAEAAEAIQRFKGANP